MNQAVEDPIPKSSNRIKPTKSAPEQRKTRHEYRGGLSVIRFLYHSSILISPDTPLFDVAKNRAITVLRGMKIRNTHGKRDKKFTFHGLTSDMTQEFQVFGEDGHEQFKLEYKKLPYLDLGMSADGMPIYLPMEWCVVYSKDNKSNERLRRLVSHETPPDFNYSLLNYPENTHLRKKWQLVFLGQNAPTNTLEKFGKFMAGKCGESGNAEIIQITEPAELKEKLPSSESGIIILVCVMEKQDKPFRRALKRLAELEKKMLTQWCKLEDVEHYCDLYVTDLHESWYVTDLVQEMIAKTGVYKTRALLAHSAWPPRFEYDCKVMYAGCNVINTFPQVTTIMVGNIGSSDCSTCDYLSKLALGDYMQNLPAIFGELLERYRAKHYRNSPDKIVLFREGFVGGKLQEILRKEVDALKGKVTLPYIPITFIVSHKKNLGNGKTNYSIFSDENGICCSEFETLINNLGYSRKCPKPLPVYYANRAARLAKVYLEGEMNPEQDKIDEITETIDRSLYVGAERQQQVQEVEE